MFRISITYFNNGFFTFFLEFSKKKLQKNVYRYIINKYNVGDRGSTLSLDDVATTSTRAPVVRDSSDEDSSSDDDV